MRTPRWSTLGVALATTVIVVGLLWWWRPPAYFTNDDAVYRLQIQGEDVPGGTRTANLVLSHALVAPVVVAAQRAFPNLPVWDLVLAAAFIAGVAVMVAIAWTAVKPSVAEHLVALCVLLAAIVPLLIGIQFTVSAVVCSGAGALLALLELTSSRSPRRLLLAVAAALILIGYFLRPMGGEAGALLVTVLALIPAAARGPRGSRVARVGIFGVLVGVVFAALNATDAKVYEWRGQADYYQYHWRIVNLIEWGGNISDQGLEQVRVVNGWSENDWDMLRRMWGVDASLFGFEQIERATNVAAMNGTESLITRTVPRLSTAIADVPRTILPELLVVASAALIASVLFGTTTAVIVTAAQLLLFAAMCVTIHAAFKELPFHLLAPLRVCLIGAVLSSIGEHRRAARAWRATLGALAGILLILLQAREATADARETDDQSRSIQAQVSEVMAQRPSLLVLHADALPFEHWWEPFRRPSIRLPIIRLGWNNQDPRLQRFLTDSRMTPLFPALCSDPSILLVANPDRLDIVTRALAEHAGIKATWTPVFLGTIRVWRCATAAAAGAG